MTEKGFKEEKEESYKERFHKLSILGFAKVCKHSRNHSLGVNKLENDRKKNPPDDSGESQPGSPKSIVLFWS